MSAEEQDLLARIGQIAGQINRHKRHQAGTVPHPQSSGYPRGNSYRGRGAFAGAQYRIARQPPVSHRHRTLHLNKSLGNACNANNASVDSTLGGKPGWVSRNDRHRQLINANVYEKNSQSRVKAIEETRQKKLKSRKNHEKAQFNDYLRSQAGMAGANTNVNSTTGRNEILIEDVRFLVADGGKKLVKSPDHRHLPTPKTSVVAGVRFHRTKTGNLVANRIVQTQRRSGTHKKSQPCKTFSTTGSCHKGPSCRYQHDPTKVAICRDFLKDGKCPSGESCDLSHDTTPERMPDCLHYARGHCANPNCPYTHSKAAPCALVCEAFGFYGFCDQGAHCAQRHVFECPDFSNTGSCKTKGCKLLHRERASLLRSQAAKAESAMDEDISSDEEPIDSDDVDSDDLAEYIEAESDDSDFENAKDFIPL